MTIQEKCKFIREVLKEVNQDLNDDNLDGFSHQWEIFLSRLMRNGYLNKNELDTLFDLFLKWYEINNTSNEYILFVNLLYKKLKNHQFKG